MRWLCFIFAVSLLAADAPKGMLLYEQTREGVDRVLEECLTKGVTRLEVVLLPAGEAKANPYGDYAMGYGGQAHTDLALPNPAFFQHLDWVLKRAAGKQIELAILPMDRDSGLLKSNSTEKALEWGRYLGRRYMKARKLVWLRQSTESFGPILAIEAGIGLFDSKHRFELQMTSK